MCESVASHDYANYLQAIARSHSIPVMDHEVDRFVGLTPHGSLVLDIGGAVRDRFTECLFHPEFGLAGTGRDGSVLGRLDTALSGLPAVGRWIARQRSFEVRKGVA